MGGFGSLGFRGVGGGLAVGWFLRLRGCPGEFEGVGAIPVGPVVGGEGGDGRGTAVTTDSALRATLGRMLPV